MPPNNNTITVELYDPNNMFQAPEFDVAQEYVKSISGIEQIKEWLIFNHRRPTALVINIHNNPKGVSAAQFEQATKFYCEEKIQTNNADIILLRKNGRSNLKKVAAIVAAVLVFLILIKSFLLLLPEWLTSFIVGGLTIATWVAVWNPVETLLYEPQPLKQQNRFYEMILTVKKEIVFVE